MSAGANFILGTRVDPTSYERATQTVVEWAQRKDSRAVYAANVHVVMEAYDDPSFRAVVNAADLVTPDGMPLVWMLRRLGFRGQSRVYGPTLMLHVCRAAAEAAVPVAFFGATQNTLARMIANLRSQFPALRVAYACAPPFRPLTPEEHADLMGRLRESGARILFVGLGCPKQERWIAAHSKEYSGVMLGVGAAFDFHAGTVRQAPPWLQRIGMEWAFRLGMEPRRLWRRYLKHNPRFALLAALQLLRARRAPPPARSLSDVDKPSEYE